MVSATIAMLGIWGHNIGNQCISYSVEFGARDSIIGSFSTSVRLVITCEAV